MYMGRDERKSQETRSENPYVREISKKLRTSTMSTVHPDNSAPADSLPRKLPPPPVSSELPNVSVLNVSTTTTTIVNTVCTELTAVSVGGGLPSDVTPAKFAELKDQLSKVGDPPAKSSPQELATMSSTVSAPPVLSATSSLISDDTPESTTARDAARNDALKLNRAFLGKDCDESTIVNILANRSATQRALIRQEYNSLYSEDIDIGLSKELRGELKEAVILWMHEPGNRDASLVRQASVEVICSRTPSQLQQLKKAYRFMAGVELELDIENLASGDTKKLLGAYVSTPRSEDAEVVAKKVDEDAKVLYEAGEKKWGTDEDTFIRIFSERSSAHLAKINSAYRSLRRKSLKKAVKKETSGNFECALLTILRCAENPGKYFAKALHNATFRKVIGTDEKTLTRIIVSRAEIDIEQIKAEYQKKYRRSLSDDVHSKTSGTYRSFLISLLEPSH